MIKPVEMMGFGPKREVINNDDGSFTVIVTPPAMVKLAPHSIRLTAEQFQRYKLWQNGYGLIQDLFPDLSLAEREVLMTGISEEDFQRMTPDDDET